jgi:pyruvate carboxylase subunit B
VKLFNEVEFIWPKLGYPPLVTPFSQYVKNVALMNIIQLTSGKERYSMIDNNTWDMILGKAGKLPGPLDKEIIDLAASQSREFYNGIPQDACPDQLDIYRGEMKTNNWDFGKDDEELFELAMHDRQYRDYRSGIARTRFENELSKAMESVLKADQQVPEVKKPETAANSKSEKKDESDIRIIASPAKGKVYYNLFRELTEPSAAGDPVNKGDRLCYLQTNSYISEITSPYDGEVNEIIVRQGADVSKGDLLFRIKEIQIQKEVKKRVKKNTGLK